MVYRLLLRAGCLPVAAMLLTASQGAAVHAAPLQAASTGSKAAPALIVRVGNVSIFEADVVEREDALIRQGETEPRARRELAIRQLIAEHMIEQQFDERGEIPPELAAQLALSRRQLMLAYVLDRRVAQTNADSPPRPDAIEAFVRENPQIFANRARFTYTRIIAAVQGRDAEKVVTAALSRLPVGAMPAPAQVNAIKSALQSAHLLAGAVDTTQNSEQVPALLLKKLERMAASGSYIDLQRKPGRIEILILQSRQADPVDPKLVHEQIAAGLRKQNRDKVALAVLRKISDPLYQRIDPSVASQPYEAKPVGENRNDAARALLRATMPNLDYFVLRRIGAFLWWMLAVGPLAMVLWPQLGLRKTNLALRLKAMARQFGNARWLRMAPPLVVVLSLAALPLGLRITSDASRDAIILSLCGAIFGGWLYPVLRARFQRPALSAGLAVLSSLVALMAVF